MRSTLSLVAVLSTLLCSVASVSAAAQAGSSADLQQGVRLLSKKSTGTLRMVQERRHRALKRRGTCVPRKSSNGTTSDSVATTVPVPVTSTSTVEDSSSATPEEATPSETGASFDTSDAAAEPSSSYVPPPPSSSASPTSSSSEWAEPAKSTPSTTPAPALEPAPEPTQDTSPIDSGSTNNYAADALGQISAFQGTNSGIMSWFRTNAGSDSTNGQSWCQTYYQDDWPCFAPSVGTMLNNFGGDYQKAAKVYCGREVLATNPNNGKTAKLFIRDGFDDRWVRTKGSIDATIGAYSSLSEFGWDKNIVVQNLQWEFTGGVVEKGTFQHGKYEEQ